MKRILMNDMMIPVEAFDLFPRKKSSVREAIKALFHATPRAKALPVRPAVAKV